MGQFKPMVKMTTTEPSVILKLKKGGKVEKKADGGFMPMASTQPAGAPARGGMAAAASPMKPPMGARRRAMMPATKQASSPNMNPSMMMKKGGKAEKHEDAAEDRAMIKKALAGKKFAKGGSITAPMAKTTVKGNAGKFAKTDMETADRTTTAKGTKGVKTGNGGGYKSGGTVSDSKVSKFVKTDMATADRNDSAKGTKGVKNGNSGGFAKGGTIKGGDWENRPADTSKPGKSGGTTGGVRNGNAGGYKEGGAAKKAYATGGEVDSGKAQAMPKKPVSRPVANSLQSGTFKRGGKVKRHAEGGLEDASKGAYDKSIGPSDDDMDMAKAIRSVPRKLYQGAKSLIGGLTGSEKAPGAVTKTKESVTVAPRKRGGSC